jgi:hypothetical protein
MGDARSGGYAEFSLLRLLKDISSRIPTLFKHVVYTHVLILITYYPAWIPDHNGVIGNVLRNNCIGSDGNVIPNPDFSKNLCSSAEVDPLTDDRAALPIGAQPALANGYLMRDVAVITDFHGSDKNASVMTNIKALADFGTEIDINAQKDRPASIENPDKDQFQDYPNKRISNLQYALAYSEHNPEEKSLLVIARFENLLEAQLG